MKLSDLDLAELEGRARAHLWSWDKWPLLKKCFTQASEANALDLENQKLIEIAGGCDMHCVAGEAIHTKDCQRRKRDISALGVSK